MIVKILVVVDNAISLTPAVDAFGIGRVVQLIRNTSVGTMNFNVTLAVRQYPQTTNPSPAPDEPKYTGFRFDQKEPDGKNTIDLFHEIWCFGFEPGNKAGPDSDISLPEHLPISDSELNILTQWMNNRQGGIFATGDHDYLGASMCSRIPRVGTMRLWTNADGVPSRTGADRIDTNRPSTPGQADIAGTPDVMPFANQSDVVPQAIEWVSWAKSIYIPNIVVRRRPHPILCHPKLGPIDLMPDHPHEGRCFDTKINPATGQPEIKLNGTYNFNGNSGDEYPTVGTIRPTPTVIAYGTTLPDPPYNHEKGDSPYKHFPMISAYDGHRINIGRVVVDSTWHHWLDLNLTQIENAVDKTNWEKISRYFINVAMWLTPKRISRRAFSLYLFQSHFGYLGFREFSPASSVFTLGSPLKYDLSLIFSPCWVTDMVMDHICLIRKDLCYRLNDHYFEPIPRPDPCLSCPPLDLVEDAVLGGMVLKTIEVIKPISEQRDRKPNPDQFEFEEFEKQIVEGASHGLKELVSTLDRSLKYTRDLFEETHGNQSTQ